MRDSVTFQQLMQNIPQAGTVEWIGIRPGKREAMIECDTVYINRTGLEGDRYNGRSGKRSVTLVQAEHLDVIASVLHRRKIYPRELRRNIVVSGLNLQALKGREFQIGNAVLVVTGLCHPCSRMEEVFGEGGYNAVRGHGGITASVIQPGTVRLNDKVSAA